MSKTNASEQFPESHQPDPVTQYSQHRFLCEFLELGTDVCEGVSSCLEVVEKGEAAAGKSTADPTEEFCALHAAKLKKLAVTSARLLGEYTIKHIAWINDDAPSPAEVMEEAENKSGKNRTST